MPTLNEHQLPIEIIIDILSRLPVKTLLQLKCVCKSWRSLISSDPEFAKLHLQQHTTLNHRKILISTCPFQSLDTEEVYSEADDQLITRQHSFPVRDPEEFDFCFVGSCNGLVSAVTDPEGKEITVWNPTTGESRQLPKPSNFFTDDWLFYGFGYDTHLDDYKVAMFAQSSSTNEVKMEMFNLKGNVWRTVEGLHCSGRIEESPVALDGVLHWLIYQRNGTNYEIVSFDLVEEKLLEMVIVPDEVSQNLGTELKVLGDDLCVCSSSYPEYFDAWRVKGYGTNATWTKLFSFSSDQFPGCEDSLHVLWVANNGNLILVLDDCQIVIYNPVQQTSKEFYPSINESGWFDAVVYLESLVSPNAANALIAAAANDQNN